MTNWTAIGIVAAAEVAVFFGGTARAFTARSRIDRERDNDIRAAIAGYEAGRVQPALAAIVEEVMEIKRLDETVGDALSRANIGDTFQRAVTASIQSQSPRRSETALVHRYIALGAFLVAAQLSAPAALYNVVTSGYNLPSTAVVVSIVIFAMGCLGALALAIFVVFGEIRLTNAIRGGKDAT